MKDIETGKPIGAQCGARRRLPPRRPLLLGLIILLTGLLWMAELHWLLWYTMNCEYLSHRDPRFVTPENNYLCLSDAELAGVLRDLAITAVTIFEAHNITYFLESGTLLGAFREHAVIRHDTDVDLGIDGHGLTYLRHHPVEVPDAYKLAVWNSALYPDSTCDDKLPARLTHKATGLYADVFAFMEWKNSAFWKGQDAVGPVASVCYSACQACPRVGERYRHFTVPRHWVYPLVDCLFEGRTFKCPRQPAKYLEHMYGKDFMIPALKKEKIWIQTLVRQYELLLVARHRFLLADVINSLHAVARTLQHAELLLLRALQGRDMSDSTAVPRQSEQYSEFHNVVESMHAQLKQVAVQFPVFLGDMELNSFVRGLREFAHSSGVSLSQNLSLGADEHEFVEKLAKDVIQEVECGLETLEQVVARALPVATMLLTVPLVDGSRRHLHSSETKYEAS